MCSSSEGPAGSPVYILSALVSDLVAALTRSFKTRSTQVLQPQEACGCKQPTWPTPRQRRFCSSVVGSGGLTTGDASSATLGSDSVSALATGDPLAWFGVQVLVNCNADYQAAEAADAVAGRSDEEVNKELAVRSLQRM